MKKIYFLLSVFFFPAFVSADMVISEVAWMGNSEHHSNEWIELYNNGTEDINLEGWELVSGDGTPSVALSGSVGARDTYILERTNDDAVPNISADIIYSGALSNTGEDLILKENGVEVFKISGTSGWQGGNNETKETMQLVDGVWITASPTPGKVSISQMSPQESLEDSPQETAQKDTVYIPGPYADNQKIETTKVLPKNNSFQPGEIVINTPVEDTQKMVMKTEEKTSEQDFKKETQQKINTDIEITAEQESQEINMEQGAQVVNTITIEKPIHPLIELLLFPVKILQFIKSLFVG